MGSNTHHKVAVRGKGAATNKTLETGLSLDSHLVVKVIIAISRVGGQAMPNSRRPLAESWELLGEQGCILSFTLLSARPSPSPPHTHLDLRLGHPQGVGQPGPLRASQVLGLLKGLLQGKDLVPREGGPSMLFLVDAVTQGVGGWQEEGQVRLAG